MKNKFIISGLLILGIGLLTACTASADKNDLGSADSASQAEGESDGSQHSAGDADDEDDFDGGDEMMLDGDYTYVDNEILMEMIKGDWKCEDRNLSLTIRDDYTMTVQQGDEAVLETAISYVFLQPGEYQDVDISVEENDLQNDSGEDLGEIDLFFTQMDFDEPDNSLLLMEIQKGEETEEVQFERRQEP